MSGVSLTTGRRAMPQETDGPAERQDPSPAETPPGGDVVANDPGPIEIDFIMKGAAPTFGDLLADWETHRRDADRGEDDIAR